MSDHSYSAEASHTRQPALIDWPAALTRLIRPLRRPGDAIDRLVAGRELAIVFATALLTQLPFIFGRYLPLSSIKYFSQDEYNLVAVIQRYQGHLQTINFAALTTETLDYGYGYLFYLLYSVVTLPFALFGGDLGILGAGRVLSAVLGAATIVLICDILRRLGARPYFVVLLGIAMALTPGMIVMHKPLSAEQFSNFLIVAAVAYVARSWAAPHGRRTLFVLAVLAAAAVAVKLNAAMEGLVLAVVGLALVYRLWLGGGERRQVDRRTVLRAGGDLVLAAGLAVGVFLLANLPILLSRVARRDFMASIELQLESNVNSQRGLVPYAGIEDWLPIADSYFGGLPWLAALFVAAILGALIAGRLRDYRIFAVAVLGLIWVLVPTAYVVGGVAKIWPWYLVLPAFGLLLGPITIGIVGERVRQTHGRRKTGSVLTGLAVLLLVIHALLMWPRYGALASERWSELQRDDFRDMESVSALMAHELGTDDLTGVNIITEPYNTFPVVDWSRRGASVFGALLPDISPDMIESVKPDYIVIRLYSFRNIGTNRELAHSRFLLVLEDSCRTTQLCYSELISSGASRTIVYRLDGELVSAVTGAHVKPGRYAR